MRKEGSSPDFVANKVTDNVQGDVQNHSDHLGTKAYTKYMFVIFAINTVCHYNFKPLL